MSEPKPKRQANTNGQTRQPLAICVWSAAITSLPSTLRTIDRTQSSAYAKALLCMWLSLRDAPSPAVHAFDRVNDAEVIAKAEGTVSRLKEPGFGFEPSGATAIDLFCEAAIHVRALELMLDLNWGHVPSDPDKAWLHRFDGAEYFIVPLARRLWGKAITPSSDTRPYQQRALIKHRIIPRHIDGATIRLTQVNWLPDRPELKLAGALFSSFELTFEENLEKKAFLATGYTCPRHDRTLTTTLRDAHKEGCTGAIFPELTINDDALSSIQQKLVFKPWEDSAEGNAFSSQVPPAFVLAGSWHRRYRDGIGNVLEVLTGDGRTIFQQAKRLEFSTRTSGAREDIIPGDEVYVMVMETALISFGICLDFCSAIEKGVYPHLDVDLIVVPSMGGVSTVQSHLHNARERQITYKSRTMVVQQAEPKLRQGHGYIVDPSWSLNDLGPYFANNVKKARTTRTWNVILT